MLQAVEDQTDHVICIRLVMRHPRDPSRVAQKGCRDRETRDMKARKSRRGLRRTSGEWVFGGLDIEVPHC